MDYKNKYLKYKTKYADAKNMLIGGNKDFDPTEEYMPPISGFEESLSQIQVNHSEDEINVNQEVQIGGSPYFPNDTVLFILANLTNQSLKQAFDQRIDILLGYKIKSSKQPHITLFELHINQDHPAAVHFQDVNFQKYIKTLYNNTFQNVTLTSPYGAYRVFGAGTKKFFVRKYSVNNPAAINTFRKGIYNYISKNFNIKRSPNKYDQIKQPNTNINFFVFSFDYNNSNFFQPLYAVSEHHFGIGNWEPHMSIIDTYDINNLKNKYPSEYNYLYNNPININNTTVPSFAASNDINVMASYLTNIIHVLGNPNNNPHLQGRTLSKMVDINMINDLASLTYSLKNIKGNPPINIQTIL